MIELKLISIKGSVYIYNFSILGLEGIVTINKSLPKNERYDAIELTNISGYYEKDLIEQAQIKYKLMCAVENGNYEDQILRMTH